MEATPLGRAEWIRFIALFFDKEEEADKIFRETESAYLAIRKLAASVEKRPTVLSEKKFGASWFVPAGQSYMAVLFADAGASYRFADLDGAGSTPLSFETVLDKAIHADYWLIKYNLAEEMDYQALKTEYTPYSSFDAFRNKTIYTCNTGKVPYYEEFPMHPDYLLKDLVWVFHPELLPDYKPRYFRKMIE
jgi:iron complex transport system substrate-binding protein